MRKRPFWYLRRQRDEISREIDEELDNHLERRIEELTASGLTVDEARREALRRFGDLERTRRYCRHQNGAKEQRMQQRLMLEEWWRDVHICVRNLRRVPGLAVTIMATVGLGIGATTAMFGVVSATLIQPLPYENADRLVRIYTDSPPNKWPFSVADFLTLQEQQTHFERVAGYVERPMSFSDGRVAERLNGRVVSWTYFATLGLRPMAGRSFSETDAKPGAPPAVIVSHAFWRQRLGARPDAIGKPVRLDGVDYGLVGVLPERVGPLETDREFFVAAQWSTPPRKGPFSITTIGRLRTAADRGTAADELRAINRRMFPIWRASYQDERATWSMTDLKTHVLGDITMVLVLALAAVALVWVIACTNAANLPIARITSRRRELAVRAALGASRGRVLRYLAVESGVLAIGAAVLGAAIAWTAIGLLRDLATDYVPRTQELARDGMVLWFLIVVTSASVCMFGLIPALFGARGPVAEVLQSLGRSVTGAPGVRRVRRLLVATQFAVATPLLIVAGLLAASLNELGRVDLGFERHNLVTGMVALPEVHYADPGRVIAFWSELRRRVETLPGVSALAFADGRPPNDVAMLNNFDLEASPTPPGRSQPSTPWVSVTPEYFQLLGLRLVSGRLLDERDSLKDAARAVVVDEAWARRFFPNGNAVGERFHEGGCTTCPWLTVVGVVSNVKYAGLDSPDEGTVYWAMPRIRRNRYLVVRTSTDPETVLPAVRNAVRELNPELPLASIATMDDLVGRSLEIPRTLSLIVGAFAVVALVLSIVGIYSVMANYVQQHSKDISIRLVLGGTPRGVLRLIVGQGMKVVLVGVIVGMLTAVALTRLFSKLLFGVGATDATTFGVVSVLMIVTALVACLTPARRAVMAQPATVLRAE